MTEKFKNKYRIKSARLPNWDYGSNGMYFITICTKNRLHFFGNVIDGEMRLNKIGELAYQFWNEIPQHFPFVKLGEFVIMPNHTHGILIMDKNGDAMDGTLDGTLDGALDGALAVEALQCNASTTHATPSTTHATPPTNTPQPATPSTTHATPPTNTPQPPSPPTNQKNQQMANISPKPGSISTIIRSYKSVVTRNARKIHANFGWQSRFHDHVIRNERSFRNISNYIINNPKKWNEDNFFKK